MNKNIHSYVQRAKHSDKERIQLCFFNTVAKTRNQLGIPPKKISEPTFNFNKFKHFAF